MSGPSSVPRAFASKRALNHKFFVGLARAFGGAIIFALPLLMTMEMWWLGFYLNPLRIVLLMVVILPMLVVLDRFSGFRETGSWLDDAVDAVVAMGVGLVASVVVLGIFRVVDLTMPLREIAGKVALQSVPAGFGAVLANSQLGGNGGSEAESAVHGPAGYAVELFLMAAGALFLAFNVAPTEEMILISYMMTEWHALALLGVSLLLIHAFVYAVDFKGEHDIPEGTPGWSMFLRFSLVGYAVSLGVSAFVLWTFGRFDADALPACMMMTVVLGFPACIGAAIARLIV